MLDTLGHTHRHTAKILQRTGYFTERLGRNRDHNALAVLDGAAQITFQVPIARQSDARQVTFVVSGLPQIFKVL